VAALQIPDAGVTPIPDKPASASLTLPLNDGPDQHMARMDRPRRFAATAFLLSTLLGACGSGGADNFGFTLPTSAGLNEEINRGFVLDQEALAKVRPGMDVQGVLQTLGTPSTTSTVGNRTFYYVSQKTRRMFQFQNPAVVEQNVVAVYFNKGFKVERVANYGLNNGVIFDFISRTTPTGGEEQSFLRNLFRGVTSFNPLSG
jgi:outer membrane protein assembly factor BamE (lipoprotein component of BamABCDE complex)